MDARFNREELSNRIRRIGEHKTDITIYNKDVNSLITNYVSKFGERTLIYFDPPYFKKGKQLYMNYFSLSDHKRIEKLIREKVDCAWLITYDDSPEIVRIYNGYEIRQFDLNYSVANKRVASELMIFPPNNKCPRNEDLLKNNVCINLR